MVTMNGRLGGVGTANGELKCRMGLRCISDVPRRGRLRLFGHMERITG